MQLFRTKDMSLSAFLNIKGIKHLHLEMQGEECFWVFEECDSLIDELLEFSSGGSTVEPKSFLFKVRKIREELFKFLDGQETAAS